MQPKAREARPHQDRAPELVSSRAAESYAAPWMQPLKRAMNHGGTQRANRDRKGGTRKQVQLATVDPATGRPAVRTIIFRGFLPDELSKCNVGEGESCLMTFVTDSRAEKVRHIRETKGPAPVEVCWWLHEAGVQFRISGDAVLACADSAEPHLRHACQMVWDRLSDSTRSTFAWPHPGAPTHTHTHRHAHTHPHTFMHTRMHTHTHARTYTHAHTHTYTHTHTHTHNHAHTHIHTHTQPSPGPTQVHRPHQSPQTTEAAAVAAVTAVSAAFQLLLRPTFAW